MKNQINKIALLIILSLLFSLQISGQTEFLITINPSTGTFSKIDSLTGVKWVQTDPGYTTFDENNHNIIFKGADINWNTYLYIANVGTASIISHPFFPVLTDPSDNVVELKYDNSSNNLYGLLWDNSESREYFVSINISTGTFTEIDSLPNVKWIMTDPDYTVFDKTHHQYIFKGADVNFNSYLYTINALTGAIISSPSFPVLTDQSDNIIQLQYDNTSNTLYGLHWDNSEGIEYFVSVNSSNGSFVIIDSLPNVKSIRTNPHYTTFDEINHRYVFVGTDINFISRLYSIDALTGSIISDPLFPNLTNPSDNIIELQFDNSSGILYALHWEIKDDNGIHSNNINESKVTVSPNPFTTSAQITFDQTYQSVAIEVYDIEGKLLLQNRYAACDHIELKRGNLSEGLYFLKITIDGNKVETRKIVINN